MRIFTGGLAVLVAACMTFRAPAHAQVAEAIYAPFEAIEVSSDFPEANAACAAILREFEASYGDVRRERGWRPPVEVLDVVSPEGRGPVRIVPRGTIDIPPGLAWALVYMLRRSGAFREVDIRFRNVAASPVTPLVFGQRFDDRDWYLRRCGIIDAAGNPVVHPSPTDRPVLIAHLDTGYTPRPDYIRHLAGRGFNVFDPNEVGSTDAIDRMSKGGVKTPGHGTSTGGVIARIAPHAQILPIRVTDGPVMLTSAHHESLIRGFERALANRCDVISMSLGTYPSERLHQVVRKAVQQGVIVIAASGNALETVAYPAAYDETIALGGTTPRDEPWDFGSRGDAVDFSAPADDIYVDEVTYSQEPPAFFHRHAFSFGTSFAAAITAGAAALWLSKLPKREVIRRFGSLRATNAAFKLAVQRTMGQDWQPLIQAELRSLESPGVLNVRRMMGQSSAALDAAFRAQQQAPGFPGMGFRMKTNFGGVPTGRLRLSDSLPPNDQLLDLARARLGFDVEGSRTATDATINVERVLEWLAACDKWKLSAYDLTFIQERAYLNWHFDPNSTTPGEALLRTFRFASPQFNSLKAKVKPRD